MVFSFLRAIGETKRRNRIIRGEGKRSQVIV